MTIQTKKLEAALTVIAKFFEDNQTNTDNKVVNRLAYTQQRILNSICYGAAQELDRCTRSTLPKARQEAADASRAHRGDELSELQLNRKLDWLERVNEQIAHLEAFAAAANATYEEATGQRYSYSPRTAAGSDVRKTDALARAAALGIKTSPATDYNAGLESTEVEHGINTPTHVPAKGRAA